MWEIKPIYSLLYIWFLHIIRMSIWNAVMKGTTIKVYINLFESLEVRAYPIHWLKRNEQMHDPIKKLTLSTVWLNIEGIIMLENWLIKEIPNMMIFMITMYYLILSSNTSIITWVTAMLTFKINRMSWVLMSGLADATLRIGILI